MKILTAFCFLPIAVSKGEFKIMCGIVGYIGGRSAADVLMDGLKRLEYRGYDSSGIAILDGNQKLEMRRSVGKISGLQTVLKNRPISGQIGLGHTRWATHGVPSEENAHPHTDCAKKIVVVHNGIIENYARLKKELIQKGHRFSSQTDTEVIAHLIEERWTKISEKNKKSLPRVELEKSFIDAVRRALLDLEGAYAIGILSSEFKDFLIAARKDCPLILGLGKDENFIASDVTALIAHTRRTISLGHEEMAVLRKNSVDCFALSGEKVNKKISTVTWDPVQAEKLGYPHYMLKEMMEQPDAIQDTLRGRSLSDDDGLLLDIRLDKNFIKSLNQIKILGCGTSYHAALVGRFWFESLAGLPCQVDIASEFRYGAAFKNPKELSIFISQSGETADTLAALKTVKKLKMKSLAICNVLGSSLTSEADTTLYTHCGPEIGVASTKAFTGQLTALLLLAIHFGIVRGTIDRKQAEQLMKDFSKLPSWIRESLKTESVIKTIAKKFYSKNHFLYLGRNYNYPIALEGALKLKEISYIHAEGYPAGEMKHGPIALIDKELPIVALVTESKVYEKISSNIEEAKTRGGIIIAVASEGDKNIGEKVQETIFVPKVPEIFSPIVNVIPLQLLAYTISVLRGCDVDQPRNLAKSVTVE